MRIILKGKNEDYFKGEKNEDYFKAKKMRIILKGKNEDYFRGKKIRIILKGRKNVIPTPTDIYLLYVVLLLAEDDGLRHHDVELDLPGHHAACPKGHLQTFILKQGYFY